MKVRLRGVRRYLFLDHNGLVTASRALAATYPDRAAAEVVAREHFTVRFKDEVAAVAVVEGVRRVVLLGDPTPPAFNRYGGYRYLRKVTGGGRGVFHICEDGVFGPLTEAVAGRCRAEAERAGLGGPRRWTVHATALQVAWAEAGFQFVQRTAAGAVMLGGLSCPARAA